ncbi:MAG: BrnT family toxin [bacterium]
MRFEWDPKKEAANREKHGIGFDEAVELLRSDTDYLEIFDEVHSDIEERFIAIGPISRGLILVVWTERIDEYTRIISARWATKLERVLYQRYVEDR